MIQKMIAQKIKIKNFLLAIITMGKIGIVAQNSIKFDTQRNKNKERKKAGVNESECIWRVNAFFTIFIILSKPFSHQMNMKNKYSYVLE